MKLSGKYEQWMVEPCRLSSNLCLPVKFRFRFSLIKKYWFKCWLACGKNTRLWFLFRFPFWLGTLMHITFLMCECANIINVMEREQNGMSGLLCSRDQTSLSLTFLEALIFFFNFSVNCICMLQNGSRPHIVLFFPEFQYQVLTRLTLLRMVQQQHGELLMSLTERMSRRHQPSKEPAVPRSPFRDYESLKRFDTTLTGPKKEALVRNSNSAVFIAHLI